VATWCIRSRAPLRISFCGGGTDVEPYPRLKGGCVLSATIDKYAYVTLLPRTDRMVLASSLDVPHRIESEVGNLEYDGALDLVKAALRYFGADRGCELFLHSDAPPGSGLGASSTMVVALVGAIAHWLHRALTPYEIAEAAYHIERKELGIAGGRQDQYAAAFGGVNFMEFYADHTVINPLRIASADINELWYHLAMVFTGVTRESRTIIERQTEHFVAGERTVSDSLDRLRALTLELKRALLCSEFQRFGELLHTAWLAKKGLDEGISTSFIESLYAVARDHGAVGGKLLGAGGGGFFLLYCPFRKRQRILQAIESAGGRVLDTQFEPDGLQVWRAAAEE
jgi:D-glycero-alpha-D-manno-heptose-7-phosphate kinase